MSGIVPFFIRHSSSVPHPESSMSFRHLEISCNENVVAMSRIRTNENPAWGVS